MRNGEHCTGYKRCLVHPLFMNNNAIHSFNSFFHSLWSSNPYIISKHSLFQPVSWISNVSLFGKTWHALWEELGHKFPMPSVIYGGKIGLILQSVPFLFFHQYWVHFIWIIIRRPFIYLKHWKEWFLRTEFYDKNLCSIKSTETALKFLSIAVLFQRQI